MAILEHLPYYKGLTLHEIHLVQNGLETKRAAHRNCAYRVRQGTDVGPTYGGTRDEFADYHDALADEYDTLLEKFRV